MKVQLVNPYRVSHLQRYGVTIRGNVTSVYPPLDRAVTGVGDLPLFSPYYSSVAGSNYSSGCDSETNKCTQVYENELLTPYICYMFRPLMWPPSGRCVTKDR
jgi:hypothetical protein